MSNGWENYRPAPIEVFHGEAMEQFHRGARFPINETFVNGIRFLNGVEVNVILADFKTKIMKEYGISSDAIPLRESNPMTLQKKILKAKIMEALMIGPLSEIESRIDKILSETCFHLAIKIDGQNEVYECVDCKKKLEWGTWREL